MAITRTLTFSGININGVAYTEHLQENAELSIEPITDLIDDGQTLPSAYDVSFSVDVYSNTLLADSNVYSDASQDPTKTWIRFDGISGGQTLNVTNIIVNGNKKFDQNRLAVTLSGTKRVTNVETAIIES